MALASETAVRAGIGALGVALMGVGAFCLVQRPLGELFSALVWFTVPAVLSDLVVLPLVAIVGAILTRGMPAWARLPTQAALVLIATVTALALPLVNKPGLRPDNPSLLNRNYWYGWAIYVAFIILVTSVWAVVRKGKDLHPPRR